MKASVSAREQLRVLPCRDEDQGLVGLIELEEIRDDRRVAQGARWGADGKVVEICGVRWAQCGERVWQIPPLPFSTAEERASSVAGE
jgi:hypothetical protein